MPTSICSKSTSSSRHHHCSRTRIALARTAASSSSSFSPANSGANKGSSSYRRAADVAVIGVGASAALAAAALSARNLKTLWLDGLPEAMIRRSQFHRKPSHTSARLACTDPKLVALALEGLEAWRSLGERFDGRGKKFNLLPLLSEGGSLDLASSVPFATSSTSQFGSGSEILEACAEAAREAGARGARLLSSSEVVEATTAAHSPSDENGGNSPSYASLLSSTNLPKKTSAGLWIPQGGSVYLPAADEAAAAGALAAGVTRWGPALRIRGWRDAGGGSRFEIRGQEAASSSSVPAEDDDDDAPVLLAEVERMVLVPPERGFEEFLACFGIALPLKTKRKEKEKEKRGAELRDVAWATVGSGSKKKKKSFTSPSFSQLSPCVLSHGLAADRSEALDSEAPRGSVALERWSFVPFNGGGDFVGTVSVPPAFARPHNSDAEVELPRDDNEVNYLEFSGRDNEEAEEENAGEEDDSALASSPFAEDARAAASAASLVIRPLAGSSNPRRDSCYAAETLVTGDGAPICGWAPLEIIHDDDGNDSEEEEQQQQQPTNPKKRERSSFGALGSEPERVLVMCPSASSSDLCGPTGGPCASPAVATAAADLLSGLSAVRGPLSARELSPIRPGVGFRCVELSRDPWEL